MVVGLRSFRAEWSNKHSGTERGRDGPIFLNCFRIGKEGVSDTVNVRSCSPGMNAFRATNLMRRRPVPAICADENWRIDFPAKILQKLCKQNDCTRHIMRKLAYEQSRFTAINQHQFRQREVRREPNLVRFLPATDFIEKARQMMSIATKIGFRFAWSKQGAVLFRQFQTVHRTQSLSAHLISVPFPRPSDKSLRK